MARMWKFHQTSFDELTTNIFDALDPSGAKFTFPTVASVMPYAPDIIKNILTEGHEIANHGYKHVKYSLLNDQQQDLEFKLSSDLFKEYRIPIHGFRAPYNNYNEHTIELVEQYGFNWDGGVGYRPEYQKGNEMFYYSFEKKSANFMSIPCHRYSDDLLIDNYHMVPEEMSKLLNEVVRRAATKGGVLMFDMHPIRIGQKKYAPVLRDLTETAHELGAWMPTVNEAVNYWKKHGSWPKGYDFCLLHTGDIDNFIFFDYFRRLI
jgi:peptidoglycan/xylan/chitin deacetylase (PgdA/CDA1 family)